METYYNARRDQNHYLFFSVLFVLPVHVYNQDNVHVVLLSPLNIHSIKNWPKLGFRYGILLWKDLKLIKTEKNKKGKKVKKVERKSWRKKSQICFEKKN